MKSSPTSPCADRRDGFSLLELLSAMAVLAIIMVILVQMAGMTSMTWMKVQKEINNFTKARAMLDLLARDAQAGIFRQDLAAFPNGTIAFYTTRPGVSGTAGTAPPRNVSLVKYEINTTSSNSILSRGDMAIHWSDPATQISFGDATDFPLISNITMRDTAPGVLGFRVVFLQADGTVAPSYTATSGTNSTRAIGIALAVVDDATLKQLTPENIQALQTAFQTKVSGTQSATEDWNTYLNAHWGTFPKTLSTGLRIFERYVPLP